MSGWLVLLVIVAAAFAGLRLLGVRGPMLRLAGAAVLFGCAGYALQGRPGLAGSPRAAAADRMVLPLTQVRHAFFGNFSTGEQWLLMSEALARRGNTADAVGLLAGAVKRDPANPHLWVGLGNALVDHAGALTPASEYAYQRAAELSPGYPGPRFFRGVALLRSGQAEAAAAEWQEVLANAPAEASWRPLVEDALAALRRPAPVASR